MLEKDEHHSKNAEYRYDLQGKLIAYLHDDKGFSLFFGTNTEEEVMMELICSVRWYLMTERCQTVIV